MSTLREARAKRVLALFAKEGKTIEEIAQIINRSEVEVCELLYESHAAELWALSRRQLSHVAIKRCGMKADWQGLARIIA